MYSEVAFERKDNLEGIRRGFDYITREAGVFRDLLLKYPESAYARREFLRAISMRSSRINTPAITKILLEAKDDESVVQAYLPLLRIVADIPPGTSEASREIFMAGQKQLAPFGRVLLAAGKLSTEDCNRIVSLPP